MASGDSAAERAAVKRAVAARYRLRAERAERVADQWSRGAEGEVVLAEVMGPLSADGYYHLDDRRLPGSKANLDHVLIGPAGVFVIDAKNWSGQLRVDGKSLRQDERRRDDHLERVRVQAVDVSTLIEESLGRRVEVRAAICFTGEAALPSRVAVDRVHLVNRDELVPFVRSLERRLDQSAVDDVMQALLARLPPRSAPDAKPLVDNASTSAAASGASQYCPTELVVFLRPWSAKGQRRIYVKTTGGADVGHLNLVTGETKPGSDAWNGVMTRLLPHYLTAEEAIGTGDAPSRGFFRRLADAVRGRPEPVTVAPIVAVYHWKKYDKERLYVNRIIDEPGVREELGYFDLATGQAHGVDPQTLPLLKWCGAQFRTVVTRQR